MRERKRKLLTLFLPVLIVWVLDQLTKHWIRYSMEYHRHDVIDGWLAFNYTQNPGMAMGMDWISTPVISVIAILATIGITIYLLKTLDVARLPYLFFMGLILGGALGNITDRLVMGILDGYGGVLEGHVVDFIHFNLTISDYPVFPYIFNVADIAISCSIVAMLIFHKRILPGADEDPEGETAASVSVQAVADTDSAAKKGVAPADSSSHKSAGPKSGSATSPDSPEEK